MSKPKSLLESLSDQFVSVAKEVIEFKLVRDEDDLEKEETTFHPKFTHQLFGDDEKIIGYSNLSIKIYYVASSLDTYLSINMKRQLTRVDLFQVFTQKPINFLHPDACQAPLFGYSLCKDLKDFKKKVKQKFDPLALGNETLKYSITDGKVERQFEIVLGNFANPKVADYHQKLQTFSIFFIQNASFIDPTDDRWLIFIIFEKYSNPDQISHQNGVNPVEKQAKRSISHTSPSKKRGSAIEGNSSIFDNDERYAVVGYSTVYPFYAYPDKTRLRISQFLILPPFQRQGHGRRLLNNIYDYAKGHESVMEICVEDPAEDFQLLRDRLDFKLFSGLREWKWEQLVWSQQFWKDIRQILKINQDQIRKCYELTKFRLSSSSTAATTKFVPSKKSKASSSSNDGVAATGVVVATDQKKDFELEVKKRLFRELDLMKHSDDSNERKQKLNEIYQELINDYTKILSS